MPGPIACEIDGKTYLMMTYDDDEFSKVIRYCESNADKSKNYNSVNEILAKQFGCIITQMAMARGHYKDYKTFFYVPSELITQVELGFQE